MYAIIRTGGKQYKVAKNDKIKVEKLEAKQGDTIQVDVLFGEGGKKAAVSAKVLEHIRDSKVTIFKKKRRHNYRRKRGHRQPLTVLEITDIKAA
jgi:large subunit ribosomal protein L21